MNPDRRCPLDRCVIKYSNNYSSSAFCSPKDQPASCRTNPRPASCGKFNPSVVLRGGSIVAGASFCNCGAGPFGARSGSPAEQTTRPPLPPRPPPSRPPPRLPQPWPRRSLPPSLMPASPSTITRPPVGGTPSTLTAQDPKRSESVTRTRSRANTVAAEIHIGRVNGHV